MAQSQYLQDARATIEYGLDRDAKMDGAWLTDAERRWHIEQLIQLEQAEALRRLADRLDNWDAVGIPK